MNPTFKVYRPGVKILHSRVPVGRAAGECCDPVICLIWKRVAVRRDGEQWRGSRKWDPAVEQ
jgi:hypothetical protein